jgi:flagellar protein FlgJ
VLALAVGVVSAAVPVAPARAGALTATVRTAGGLLNVRSGPTMSYPVVAQLRYGAPLAVSCQVSGQLVAGVAGTTALWDRLTDGRYVADAYVAWPGGARPAVPWCSFGAHVRTRGGALNLRANASTLSPATGQLAHGTAITVACQLAGESVTGPAGSTVLWDRLPNGRYLADAYVAWPGGARPAVAWCAMPLVAPPAAGAAFVTWAAVYARQTRTTYRVPASVTIAQAILESGWGRSSLTHDGNNYFGMKCFGTPGPIAAGCRPYRTTECVDDTCFATRATFRVYTGVAASFRDHGRQLATLARYRPAFAYVGDPDRFAVELHRAGYATDPGYAQSLINLMRRYNLYRFDR